ncbi:MAG: hypothetical protein AB1505_02170, partial [Candidatus Latescibacterota bacterium]
PPGRPPRGAPRGPPPRDAAAGAVVLRWSQYAGPGFQAYRVLRGAAGAAQAELLAELASPADTTYAGSSAVHGSEYEYRVQVVAADREVPGQPLAGRLVLAPVELTRANFASATASAELGWTRYRGPRFRAYRLLRRTEELAPRVVAEVTDVATTATADSYLTGNTAYYYQVVVVTARGEEVASAERSGAFHRLVDTWPLALESGGYARLYGEGDRLAVLTVPNRHEARLHFLGPQGTLVGDLELLNHPAMSFDPRSVATAVSPQGERYLSLGQEGQAVLLRYAADGRLLRQEEPVLLDSLPVLAGLQAQVNGEIGLRNIGEGRVAFDDVSVSTAAGVVFADDFAGGDLAGWRLSAGNEAAVEDGQLVFSRERRGYAVRTDSSWQDYRLEADVVLVDQNANAQVLVGSAGYGDRSSHSSFSLELDHRGQQVALWWRFVPPPGSGGLVQGAHSLRPLAVLLGLPYRVGLGYAQGQVSAWVSSPVYWRSRAAPGSPWTSLALAEDVAGGPLAFTAGEWRCTVSAARREIGGRTLGVEVSETRVWRVGRSLWLGVCVPQTNQVSVLKGGLTRSGREFIWPSNAGFSGLSSGMGRGPGEMLAPLSFDGSADGRVYVLDAGNARIEVFDGETGRYLTEWGRRGWGPGEFDFGQGTVAEDFAGSVAVDDEGYVYVADVFNQRIQKFEP